MTRCLMGLLVVAVACGCTITATETAKAPDAKAVLALTVNVKGAEVFIDDALFGQIQAAGRAQNFAVAPGKHALVVKKFGFEDKKLTIGVEAGGVNTLLVELQRTPAVPVDVKVAPSEKAAEAKEVKGK